MEFSESDKFLGKLLKKRGKKLLLPSLIKKSRELLEETPPKLEEALVCLKAVFETDRDNAEANSLYKSALTQKWASWMESNLDDLKDDDVDELFFHLKDQGMPAGAFGIADMEKLETREVKIQLIKLYKDQLKNE